MTLSKSTRRTGVKRGFIPLIVFLFSFSAAVIAQVAPSAQISSAQPRILAPAPSYVFPDNQTYTYAVEWHFFTAGVATIRMEPAGTQRNVIANADSAGVVNLLYTVRDRFQSSFDPKTFCSQRIAKHVEEGSHQRETEIQFDYAAGKSVLQEKNLKTNETKKVENEIPGCVTDVVAGFYYLASLPLVNGATYNFPINDGNKTAEVRVEVEGKEQVKVPAGSYSTIRVGAEAVEGPLKGKGKLSVWYSDDAARTPVQMRARLSWGTLLFRLQKTERNP